MSQDKFEQTKVSRNVARARDVIQSYALKNFELRI